MKCSLDISIFLKEISAAAVATKSLQSCLTLCDPIDGSPPGSPSLGFSRQEHWSGLPFPSPMQESESEIAQSCPTLSDPMDCSPTGSSVHGIFQARVLECHCLRIGFILSSSLPLIRILFVLVTQALIIQIVNYEWQCV